MRRLPQGLAGIALGLVLGAVIATATTATAARLITGQQIKDGSISRKDLSAAVRAELVRAAASTPGPAGAQGPKGDPGPSAGTAGGDLTGQYPAPTLGAGVVGAPQLGPIQVVTDTEMLPTGQSTQLGVQCPDGSTLLGGGGVSGLLGLPISGSAPGNAVAWQVIVRNDSGVSAPVRVWAFCLLP